MNVSLSINLAVAYVLPPIGTSQADPMPTLVAWLVLHPLWPPDPTCHVRWASYGRTAGVSSARPRARRARKSSSSTISGAP